MSQKSYKLLYNDKNKFKSFNFSNEFKKYYYGYCFWNKLLSILKITLISKAKEHNNNLKLVQLLTLIKLNNWTIAK